MPRPRQLGARYDHFAVSESPLRESAVDIQLRNAGGANQVAMPSARPCREHVVNLPHYLTEISAHRDLTQLY
jgi:hypothetical protein